MNEDRIAGTARNPGNNVKKSVGRVTGHAKGQADGLINQAAGAAQDLYGQARETASDAAYLMRQGATDAEHYVRRIIEQHPYATAFAAFCVGLFIGRIGRRAGHLSR